jgi:hypothetical protein
VRGQFPEQFNDATGDGLGFIIRHFTNGRPDGGLASQWRDSVEPSMQFLETRAKFWGQTIRLKIL